MIWVALTNLVAIVYGIVLFSSNLAGYGSFPGLKFGVVLAINISSILLLYPMLKMDPIKPFLIPSLIWFGAIVIIYIIMGLYWFLVLAVVQLAADLWFEYISRHLIKNQ
jgi:hypothetical protein